MIPNLLFSQEQFSKEGEKFYLIGEKNKENEKYEEAILNYEKAAELRYDFALWEIASYYLMIDGEENKTLEYLNRYIEIGGKYAWAFDTRANLYEKRGKHNLAINDYLKVLEYDPTHEYIQDPFQKIGFCYLELENLNKACEYFKQSKDFVLKNKEWMSENCK